MFAIATASEAHAGNALPCWPAALETDVVATARGFDGTLNVYVKDLSTGEEYGHNALTPAYLASTTKLLVMAEVLRQVDSGLLTLDQAVTFNPEDLRDGAGPVKSAAPGTTFTVAFLLDVMMGDSDNTATDLLIRLVGLENVNKNAADRGLRLGPVTTLLDVRRHVYGALHPDGFNLTPEQIFELWLERKQPARAQRLSKLVKRSPAFTAADLERAWRDYYRQNLNTASMQQMGALLEQLSQCTGLSPTSCQTSHALLRGCRTGSSRIRAGIPPQTVWAHKTGTQHRRACDVGLLYVTPERPVALAVCARDFERPADADRALARVGKAVWKALSAESCPVTGASPAAGLPR
ncbi:MAG: serine hydrolase [Myxococcaceae bacterium]